jgi:hypothetical protein
VKQLIKPFHGEDGQTVFVPAIIYGSDGADSSRTKNALNLTLQCFVEQYNKDKQGIFTMASSLYPDGQATVVNLGGDWNYDQLSDALRRYQIGAFQEWMTELDHAMHCRELSCPTRNGENPEKAIKKYSLKISHLLNPNDCEVGLPRLFFREQRRSNIGLYAEPQKIHQVTQDDAFLHTVYDGFKALQQGKPKVWRDNKGKIVGVYEGIITGESDFLTRDFNVQEFFAYFAILSAKPDDPIMNPSSDLVESLFECTTKTYDDTGSYYRRKSKYILSFILDKALENLDFMNSQDLKMMCHIATEFLEDTTENKRREIIPFSHSSETGQYNIKFDFEPNAEEEKAAGYWCQFVKRLEQVDPEKAFDFAQRIRKQYPEELAYTSQQKLAKEIIDRYRLSAPELKYQGFCMA